MQLFELHFDLNLIRILLAFSMLFVASTVDIKKREINDMLWIVFGAIATVLVFLEPNLWSTITHIGFSMIIAPVALFVWRMGVFGGADALALITLAALVPYPNATFTGKEITPFTTLTNAAILSVTPIITNIIRNLLAISKHEDIFEGFHESRLNKVIAMFIGYRAKNPKYSFLIEKTENNTKRLDFSLHHAENATFCDTNNTWVTPGIPYLIYITGGFLIQVFYGDIIFNFLRAWTH